MKYIVDKKNTTIDVPKVTFYAIAGSIATGSINNDEGTVKLMELLAENSPVLPASNFVPDWYKKLNNDFVNEGHKYALKGDPDYAIAGNPPTVKRCPGVFDFLHAGYIVPAWSDFFIRWNGDDEPPNVSFSYAVDKVGGVGIHEYKQAEGAPFFNNSCKDIIKLKSPWTVSTSEGISLMILQPYYHNSTDITIMPGLLDSDVNRISNKLLQIFIKVNTQGKNIFIERGTPLLQIIPFKRSDYKFECITRPTEEMYKDFEVLGVEPYSRIQDIPDEVGKDISKNTKCPFGHSISDPNRRSKAMLYNRKTDGKNYNKKD